MQCSRKLTQLTFTLELSCRVCRGKACIAMVAVIRWRRLTLLELCLPAWEFGEHSRTMGLRFVTHVSDAPRRF